MQYTALICLNDPGVARRVIYGNGRRDSFRTKVVFPEQGAGFLIESYELAAALRYLIDSKKYHVGR